MSDMSKYYQEGILSKGYYLENNNLAVILLNKTDLKGPPLLTITVNTDEILPPNQAYVKDYAENEGILKVLEQKGLVTKKFGEKKQGFITLYLIEFDIDKMKSIYEASK